MQAICSIQEVSVSRHSSFASGGSVPCTQTQGGGLRLTVEIGKSEIDKERRRNSKEYTENMPKDIDVVIVGSCVQDLVR